MVHPPVIWSIELSESLLDAKIIAEAWDAAGLYQIGYFPGYRWAEWNGRFRDNVRRFVRGDPGLVAAAGSAHGGQFRHLPGQRPPAHQQHQLRDRHDGFTLNDLVSTTASTTRPTGRATATASTTT